ncbi:recombinase RecA, partial [Bacillus thuringiensis]|nr:recombinase RecA [Bacillus thuringiensis]
RLGLGRENSSHFLTENTDLREEIAFLVLDHPGIGEDSGVEDTEDATLQD